jgi:hypothetical protein
MTKFEKVALMSEKIIWGIHMARIHSQPPINNKSGTILNKDAHGQNCSPIEGLFFPFVRLDNDNE